MPEPPAFTNQDGFSARFEWGESGLMALAPHVDIVVIVDVLSFSTSVAIACERGAEIQPVASRERASEIALKHGALMAGSADVSWSLRPTSMVAIPNGTRLVLPSPNGARLTALAEESSATVLVGSLRNASAIGAYCRGQAGSVAVIAAGERWGVTDGPLRPSFEDQIGAGAILAAISGNPSPEARSAIAAFEATSENLLDAMWECASGRELVERGFPGDVALAAELDTDRCVPIVQPDGFIVASRKDA